MVPRSSPTARSHSTREQRRLPAESVATPRRTTPSRSCGEASPLAMTELSSTATAPPSEGAANAAAQLVGPRRVGRGHEHQGDRHVAQVAAWRRARAPSRHPATGRRRPRAPRAAGRSRRPPPARAPAAGARARPFRQQVRERRECGGRRSTDARRRRSARRARARARGSRMRPVTLDRPRRHHRGASSRRRASISEEARLPEHPDSPSRNAKQAGPRDQSSSRHLLEQAAELRRRGRRAANARSSAPSSATSRHSARVGGRAR